MKLSVGFFLPKGMYPSLSIGGHLKINTWHSFRSIELVKASRENFLAFVDHIGQFLLSRQCAYFSLRNLVSNP